MDIEYEKVENPKVVHKLEEGLTLFSRQGRPLATYKINDDWFIEKEKK